MSQQEDEERKIEEKNEMKIENRTVPFSPFFFFIKYDPILKET